MVLNKVAERSSPGRKKVADPISADTRKKVADPISHFSISD
jgi:hypothetical protein